MPVQPFNRSGSSQCHEGDLVDPPLTPRSDDGNQSWSYDVCFNESQRSMSQYWAEHGLTMNHSDGGTASSVCPTFDGGAHCAFQASTLPTPYLILPQNDYIPRRRFEVQPPITFRTTTSGFFRLVEAMHGRWSQLQSSDDAVVTGDNLSQKQSLRLEIIGCNLPYEKQINVRNPANHSRSITRGRLAEKVAKEIFDFMKRHQQGPFGEPSLGLGPGTKGYERIVLIELRHVSKSSWQPILGVLQ